MNCLQGIQDLNDAWAAHEARLNEARLTEAKAIIALRQPDEADEVWVATEPTILGDYIAKQQFLHKPKGG